MDLRCLAARGFYVGATLALAFLCMQCQRRIVPVAPADASAGVPPASTVLSDTVTILPEAVPEVPPHPSVQPVLIMRKTGCYGSCPVFDIQINSDRTAVWIGRRNVERTGLYRAAVPKEWWEHVKRHTEEQGFFSFSRRYPDDGSVIADLPHTFLTMQRGAIRHTVDNGGNAPLKLRQLETWLLEQMEVLEWRKAQ